MIIRLIILYLLIGVLTVGGIAVYDYIHGSNYIWDLRLSDYAIFVFIWPAVFSACVIYIVGCAIIFIIGLIAELITMFRR